MLMRLLSSLGLYHPASPEARAIAELQAYTDRELADLGIARSEIVDAVRNGRPDEDRPMAANDTRNDSRRAA